MNVHLVGNGASNSLYHWHNQDFTVACNIPKTIYPYSTLSIIDLKVLLWLDKNRTAIKPVEIWCTPEVKTYAENKSLPGDYKDVYEKKHRYNSGHHAIKHMAKTHKIIHMWGMDSMFTTDLTSQMDDRVVRTARPNLNMQWRPNWTTVFNEAPNTQFIVHIPEGAEGVDYAKNCCYQHHKK
jgi:hypothetical protein|tara:strand:+ start:3129 stop:3671 length:543 start_codon:yes stop_codon:yes gene_type:complete